MKRIIAVLMVLMVMMSSVSFATTSKTTFASTAEINGIWLKSDSLSGYYINGNEISLVKREKGTAKLTYIKDTESKSKPTLSKDKKSITFKVFDDESISFTVKKDTKGTVVWYLGKKAVPLKHFKTKEAVDKYFKVDKSALAVIKREADYIKELKDYSWLTPGAPVNIATESILEAMSIYGSSDEKTLKGEHLLIGTMAMEYYKENVANVADWTLFVDTDVIEMGFTEVFIDEKVFAITTDALDLLYPASAKIGDVSKKIIADIKSTKKVHKLGTFYALSDLAGKKQTINGITFSYTGEKGAALTVIIKK